MRSLLHSLEEALFPHVSAINARVVIERSRRVLRDPNRITDEDRARFLLALRGALRFFMSEDHSTAIVDGLEQQLMPGTVRNQEESLVFALRDEGDLRLARARARDACLACAASATDAQRIATAVSELGRNIISYTPGGRIEIEVRRGPPTRVRLVASDRGSGIPNLEDVLAGRYRSKTGLGRGLRGVKRLMNQFRVHTSGEGTRIEAEVTFLC